MEPCFTFTLACVAADSFPFPGGDRTSELKSGQAKEHTWSKQKLGEKWGGGERASYFFALSHAVVTFFGNANLVSRPWERGCGNACYAGYGHLVIKATLFVPASIFFFYKKTPLIRQPTHYEMRELILFLQRMTRLKSLSPHICSQCS